MATNSKGKNVKSIGAARPPAPTPTPTPTHFHGAARPPRVPAPTPTHFHGAARPPRVPAPTPTHFHWRRPPPTPTPTHFHGAANPPPPTPTHFHGASTSSHFSGGSSSLYVPSHYLDRDSSIGAASSSVLPVNQGESEDSIGDNRKLWLHKCIFDLLDYDSRGDALSKLYEKRNAYEDMAPLVWYSYGTMARLLQEVISVYPLLSHSSLTIEESNRACYVLALLQCVAGYPGTRIPLSRALIPCYMNPFLDPTNKSTPFEHLRLSALGVIGALVKDPNDYVTRVILDSETLPLLLQNMESGPPMINCLSRKVATFIVERILQSNAGLEYVCCSPEQLFPVNRALRSVVFSLHEQSAPQLFRLVIGCYLRLSQDERGVPLLIDSFPERLIDGTFETYLREDHELRMLLHQLLDNVQVARAIQEGVVINIISILIRLRYPPNVVAAY